MLVNLRFEIDPPNFIFLIESICILIITISVIFLMVSSTNMNSTLGCDLGTNDESLTPPILAIKADAFLRNLLTMG